MKKISVPNSVPTQPKPEISKKKTSKKIQKVNSNIISIQNRFREIEKEKKILVPNYVHTRPGQENFEKNSKKILGIKKPISSLIFRQKEIR